MLLPSLSLLRDMAYSICKARGGVKVGIKWANSFLERRRLCDDPKFIQDWFTFVDNTIKKLAGKDA
ncbi:hypothetical protein V1512DRAFT_267986 [Lipomyces arxii]|uniref:uncharacterized protein n=1 Tax=Lipomyces arxii TaxID=56418 RepID=UPI0034CECB18